MLRLVVRVEGSRRDNSGDNTYGVSSQRGGHVRAKGERMTHNTGLVKGYFWRTYL